MNPWAVPTLEKNHFCKYEQQLSCISALTSPKGSKSTSMPIYSTLINKFTKPIDANANGKNKLLLSNSQAKLKFRAIIKLAANEYLLLEAAYFSQKLEIST